jgi:hypothetical protein
MPFKHLFLAALAVAPAMRAQSVGDSSLAYAREASAMLGPTLWKRVILVHNGSAGSRYPASFGAVVFEMGGILWFYTATDGTQSLSLRRGRAKEDERNLGPLLAGIDPGFSLWEFDPPRTKPDETATIPPNACFIQSIALLRHSRPADIGAGRARLLSFYVTLPAGVFGHTVLYLETDEGPAIIDPLRPNRLLRIPGARPGDARSVALGIRRDISDARWVPASPGDFAACPDPAVRGRPTRAPI